jgi:hypothetical protein
MAVNKKGFYEMNMKAPKKAEAAATTTTASNDKNISVVNYTTRHATESSKNLKEQIGLLLCHLQNPLSKRQRRMGWQLFEVLLTQYTSDRPRAATSEKVGTVRLKLAKGSKRSSNSN